MNLYLRFAHMLLGRTNCGKKYQNGLWCNFGFKKMLKVVKQTLSLWSLGFIRQAGELIVLDLIDKATYEEG